MPDNREVLTMSDPAVDTSQEAVVAACEALQVEAAYSAKRASEAVKDKGRAFYEHEAQVFLHYHDLILGLATERDQLRAGITTAVEAATPAGVPDAPSTQG